MKRFYFWVILKQKLEYAFIFKIFIGGSDYQQTYYDFILEFSPDTEAWTQVGVMTRATAAHGVANVNFEDFKDECSFTRLPSKVDSTL